MGSAELETLTRLQTTLEHVVVALGKIEQRLDGYAKLDLELQANTLRLDDHRKAISAQHNAVDTLRIDQAKLAGGIKVVYFVAGIVAALATAWGGIAIGLYMKNSDITAATMSRVDDIQRQLDRKEVHP